MGKHKRSREQDLFGDRACSLGGNPCQRLESAKSKASKQRCSALKRRSKERVSFLKSSAANATRSQALSAKENLKRLVSVVRNQSGKFFLNEGELIATFTIYINQVISKLFPSYESFLD